MNLNDIRDEIDAIDSELVALFCRRMDCSRKVAEYKRDNHLPIFNAERENRILDKAAQKAGSYGNSARQLYATIMALSRALQHDLLGSGQSLKSRIDSAHHLIPYDSSTLRLACFGAEGSYAHRAAGRLFPKADPQFCPSFREVFESIENGSADFGIVPIENSSAGSVTAVYDLMLAYRCSIAAEIHIPVQHCLAAGEDISAAQITDVYSHPQALSQCSDAIRSYQWQPHEYPSTAAAARMLAENPLPHSAAICSEEAARQYGLHILMQNFQNDPANTTRFLAISKELYIEENADRISLCFSLPHTTGSLYSTLCRFAADGMNLTKIESRPKAGTSFEYLFYLDFTGNVSDPHTLSLLRALSEELSDFSFLGNYRSRG